MIAWIKRRFRQWRCKHDGKWYNPVYGFVGAAPWAYCCKCGYRRIVDSQDYKDGKITHDQKDIDFR